MVVLGDLNAGVGNEVIEGKLNIMKCREELKWQTITVDVCRPGVSGG